MTFIRDLLRDQSGAAAIQHALVIGVLTIAVLAGSFALRGPLTDLYAGMADQANGALAVQPAAGPADQEEG